MINDRIIEAYLASNKTGFASMDEDTFQPFGFAQIDPIYAREWMELYAFPLMERAEKSVIPLKEQALGFHSASHLRSTLLFDNASVSWAGVPRNTRERCFAFYSKLLHTVCNEDPFAQKKNVIHSDQEIRNFFAHMRNGNPEIARSIGRLSNACYNLSYGLYFEMFPSLVYENYGPYDASSLFGPGHTMLIREFNNVQCPEIWEQTRNFPYKKILVVAVYKDVDIQVDAITHLITKGDLLHGLKKAQVWVDGKVISFEMLESVIQTIEKKAIEMWQNMKKIDREEQKQKYIWVRAFSYKPLADRLGIDWRPPSAILEKVKNVPLITYTKPITWDYWRLLFDPREETPSL